MRTIDEINAARDEVEFGIAAFLRAKGWRHTSSTPGCFWLWEKTIDGRTFLTDRTHALGIQEALDAAADEARPEAERAGGGHE